MSFFVLILLGIIQGLTEFLPVSSSGHLVLLYKIFGIENDVILLSILLHMATLLAVIVYYRKEIVKLIRHPFCKTNLKIVVTTIATCLVVLALHPILKSSFGGSYLSLCFVISGILLWISDIFSKKESTPCTPCDITNIPMTYTQAFVIGLSQGVACIPGISRSGTTIALSKLLGIKNINTTYSFLISIPIIIGSLLLEIISGARFTSVNIWGVLIAFVICFVIGLASIKVMTNFVRQNSLKVFSIYLFILALFMILNNFWFKLF